MRYKIHHATEYLYDEAVKLHPHVVRLCPRSDGYQMLESFELLVTPTPVQQIQVIDLDGNTVIKVWFDQKPTEFLAIHAISQVETHRTNPFGYLLEPWATKLPIDYPMSLLAQLKPYLVGQRPGFSEAIDPISAHLAQEIWLKVGGDPTSFLIELNNRIYQRCEQLIRETGDPYPPGITWTEGAGSCRDFSVLFIEVCRAIGVAARFVSGYQEGDPDTSDFHLHAWAEVYLPGAGWVGYDPTQGLAVADRHVALVASSFSQYTAPVTGSFAPGASKANMTYQLTIQTLHQNPD
jgi:transglutaminase-like putative cysteine protease